MRKKGFTLIELIAVLVIMAILALIVTPLVISIIRKARVSADKRSIDAYGRSVELAIADYLLDTGAFPTSIGDLTIEYSGPEVICSTTQLNPDSSVYLTGCTVGGKSVDYTYGEDKNPPTYEVYNVGDEVSYNGVDYYVIKNSGEQEESVMLLKGEPLTVSEVNQYGGVGTENNIVNKYSVDSTGTAYNQSSYGGMAYYENENCYYKGSGSFELSECRTDYEHSAVKKVVEAWANTNTNSNDLLADNAGYKVRLITFEEISSLGFELVNTDTSGGVNMKWKKTDDTPSWVNSSGYYWIMSQYNDSSYSIYNYMHPGILDSAPVAQFNMCVRPVIILSKSAISS